MTAYVAVAAAFLVGLAIGEVRYIRRLRAERLQAIERLARGVGIGPALGVARGLGWVAEGDVRSDGDNVQIRLRRWRPLQR